MDVDGVITVLLGIAIAVLGVLSLSAARRRWQAIGAVVFSVLVVIIAWLDISEIRTGVDTPVTEDIGIGLWLTLAGGLVAAVGAILVLTRTPKQPTTV
jgi:predicted membrane channel-forming protein YqfA (hemolysin III family)